MRGSASPHRYEGLPAGSSRITGRTNPMGAGLRMVAEVSRSAPRFRWTEGIGCRSIQHSESRPCDRGIAVVTEQPCPANRPVFSSCRHCLQGVRRPHRAGESVANWARASSPPGPCSGHATWVPALTIGCGRHPTGLARELGADAVLQCRGDLLDQIAALCERGKPRWWWMPPGTPPP